MRVPPLAFALALACGCPKGEAPVRASPTTKATAAAVVVGRAASSAPDAAGTHVLNGDGPIAGDNNPDGVVTVRVLGALKGVALISVDDAGAPAGGQQWDTFVGEHAVPAGLGGFTTGGETWQLGVVEANKTVNQADGSLDLPAGDHALTLYYQSTIDPGTKLRLAVVRADGKLQWSDVFTSL